MTDTATETTAQEATTGTGGNAGTTQGTQPNAEGTQRNGNGNEGGQNWLDSLPAEAREEIRRLRGESANYRTRAKEYEAKVQQFEDRDKTETQKLAERAEKLERELAEERANVARTSVAAKFGLTPDQAKFLPGSTAEEMESAAKALFGDPSDDEGQSHRGDQGRRRDWGQGARGTRPARGGKDALNDSIRARLGGR